MTDTSTVDLQTSVQKDADSAQSILARQWRYVQDDHSWVLPLVILAWGMLPSFLEPGLLAPEQGVIVGLLLLALAGAGYRLMQARRFGGMLFLLFGACLIAWLQLVWSIQGGALILILIPVLLASLYASTIVSGLIAVLMLIALALPSTIVALPISRHDQFAAGFMILMIWILIRTRESAYESILKQLMAYYTQSRQLLEETRDHRLALAQSNRDLAEALEQLRRLNSLLQASRLEAELARKTKEEFVANVSHELRTPLNMIIGFCEMIMFSPETYGGTISSSLLSDVRVIHRNSCHLSDLINDVLVLSQTEAGQLQLNRSWVDVATVVQEAIQAVEPLLRTKGVGLDVSIPQGLPPVFCDQIRIRQVLLNLLSNAGRHTPSGAVSITVNPLEHQVQIAVKDDGPGIAFEKQKLIFEPFQQAEVGSQASAEGSGLGLSISRKLVELHGGAMWLESAPGSGSTFYLALPNHYFHGVEDDVPLSRWINPYAPLHDGHRRSLPRGPAPKERILVLERHDTLHRQLHALLDWAEVVHVQNVEDIGRGNRITTPAVVVVNDAGAMQDKAFSRKLSNLPERTPIISCYLPGDEEAHEKLNVAKYLLKPVTRAGLIAATAEVTPPSSTIMIVEDKPDMARLLRRQLLSADQGYQIISVADGESALRLLSEHRPDLMLLDIGLPDLDGYEVLRRKNEDPCLRTIPVIIISARDPLGGTIVVGRIRMELVGGLSVRHIAVVAEAISDALAPTKRARHPRSPERSPG